MLNAVHHQKNVICSYVLRLEGDDAHPSYWYVGWTKDLEMRLLAHMGVREGGAEWTALHTPEKIESVTIHSSEAEAVLCEVATYNLWLGKVGPDRVRGGRINCTGPLKYPPRGYPRKKTPLENEESTST